MTGQKRRVDPAQLALDPEVRAAVFATVTEDEAYRIMRSRAGEPWCNVMVAACAETAALYLGDYPKGAEELRAGAHAVTGFRFP